MLLIAIAQVLLPLCAFSDGNAAIDDVCLSLACQVTTDKTVVSYLHVGIEKEQPLVAALAGQEVACGCATAVLPLLYETAMVNGRQLAVLFDSGSIS